MEWSNGQQDLLSSTDFKTADISRIKCLWKKHEFFESELANQQERVEQLVAIGKELARLRYPNMNVINHRCTKLCETWQTLIELSSKRKQILTEMQKTLEQLDDLHLKFASLASPFNNWASSTREDLVDTVIVTEMREIEQLFSDHSGFKETLPDADSSLKEILDLDQVTEHIRPPPRLPFKQTKSLVQNSGLDSIHLHNPYTDLTVERLTSLWSKIQALIPIRDVELEQEHERQKSEIVKQLTS